MSHLFKNKIKIEASKFSADNSKYQISNEDSKKIYLLDFSNNVALWVTEGPSRDTTTKFVYQLWKNVDNIESKMNREGDFGYGDPDEFSPYAISKNYWDKLEKLAFPKKNYIYQQFWFFEKIPNVTYVKGDLTNKKVQDIFMKMSGTGAEKLIGMNDSLNRLTNRFDDRTEYLNLDYGNEIKKLTNKNFIKVDDIKLKDVVFDNNKIDVKLRYSDINYTARLFLKGKVPPEYKNQSNEFDSNDILETYDGDVTIHGNGLNKFLKAFKNVKIINGDLDCYNCDSLKSLEGFPEKVQKTFRCRYCSSIESLEGGPKEVGRNFLCDHCESLKSLKGAPENVNEFECHNCDSLTSLEGAPKYIRGNFRCSSCNSLKSLEGAPKEVNGNFVCDHCDSLTSLKGAPKKVNDVFECSFCKSLLSLEGAPKKVMYFTCNNCNSLKSLEGAPVKVGGDFDCSECPSLKSLEGAPVKVGGDFDCSECESLESLEGAPKEVGEDFICIKCSSLKDFSGKPKDIRGIFLNKVPSYY